MLLKSRKLFLQVSRDMIVRVKLYTILKKYGDGKISIDNKVYLQQDITLQDLSYYLDIPNNIGLVFSVNNVPKDKEYRLSEGDEVKIFPLICGG